MAISMKRATNNLPSGNAELAKALGALQADVANLAAALNTLATKLNADAGVTDTDYVGLPAANLQSAA